GSKDSRRTIDDRLENRCSARKCDAEPSFTEVVKPRSEIAILVGEGGLTISCITLLNRLADAGKAGTGKEQRKADAEQGWEGKVHRDSEVASELVPAAGWWK